MTGVVAQHSFGGAKSGGPVVALERMLESRLSNRYRFVRVHQQAGVGGIDFALIRRWMKQLRSEKVDVIHVRGLGNEGFQAVLAARLAGCPRILVSIHGTVRDLVHPPRPLRHAVLVRLFEPLTLRWATDVVTVCRAMEERAFLDPVRQKVRAVIPNGVELGDEVSAEERANLRSRLGLRPNQVALVSVGRLSREKGHLAFARALALCEPEVLSRIVLVLIGDGSDRDEILSAYGAVSGLEVRLLGHQSDVVGLLPAADVFVFPTLHENLSNALLEAMSVGLPAIASAVGGNVEVLENGGGILVPAKDEAGFASAVTRLVRDPAMRAAMGARAREVVAERYTLDHMIDAWDACYQAILSTGRDPR